MQIFLLQGYSRFYLTEGYPAISGTLAFLLVTLPLMCVPVGIFVTLCKVSDFFSRRFLPLRFADASVCLSATLPACRTGTPWPPRQAICASLGRTWPSSPCANASSADHQCSQAGRTARRVKTWHWREQHKTEIKGFYMSLVIKTTNKYCCLLLHLFWRMHCETVF